MMLVRSYECAMHNGREAECTLEKNKNVDILKPVTQFYHMNPICLFAHKTLHLHLNELS